MALVFLLFLFALPSLSHQQRIRLIHRDSPDSPLFDSTADKWLRAHRRSVAYRDHFRAAVEGRSNSLMPLAVEDDEAGFDQLGGEYLMEFDIGTPPVPVTAMVDVAGDFIWTQCIPCTKCVPYLGPLYDPSKSSTHATVSCSDTTCTNLESQCGANDTCEYIRYCGQDGRTTGPLISDVFTLAGVAHDGMTFGCSSNNSFATSKANARVGLLGSVFALMFNFNLGDHVPPAISHCFVMDWNDTGGTSGSSNLLLGKDAKLGGSFSTPLATCEAGSFSCFYSPTLEGIDVEPEALNITADLFGGSCSTVFTSSTPVTFLKQAVFDILASKVKQYAELPVAEPILNDPWDLCFNGTLQDVLANKLPVVDLHFPGLELSLDRRQLYAQVDGGRVCLLMAPTDGVNMIGTYAQTNRDIAYDLSGTNNSLILGSLASGCNC